MDAYLMVARKKLMVNSAVYVFVFSMIEENNVWWQYTTDFSAVQRLKLGKGKQSFCCVEHRDLVLGEGDNRNML